MRHNIALYDTGKVNSYRRRNSGWAFASCFGAGLGQIFLVPFFIASIVDPTMGGMVVTVITGLCEALLLGNLALFATHRNFMLPEAGTDANDALYLLPKAERKRWKVSRSELHALKQSEANRLVNVVTTYRSNNPGAAGTISKLTQALNDINDEYRMIEGR